MKYGRLILPALAVLVLSGCAHKKPPNRISECHQTLAQIVILQTERSEAGKQMLVIVQAFKDGQVRKQDYMEIRERWLNFENATLTRLGKLYYTAEEKNCFDDIEALREQG